MVNPNRTPAADLAEIRRGLQVYCQQGLVYELRALGTGIEGKGVTFGYYDDLDRMAEDVASLSGKARGIYFTPNPVNPDLLQHSPNHLKRFIRSNLEEGNQGNALTYDADIMRRRWLLVDFDPVRSNGIKGSPATDAEEQAAINQGRALRDWLRSLGWPDPLIVASGKGCQLSYPIDLPNDDESQILVERCLHAVAHLLRNPAVKLDTSVYNAGRIWKVPGTLSRKGTPSPDRPHRLARILVAPDTLEVVALAQLEALAAMGPGTAYSRPTARQVDASLQGQGDYSTLDAVSWFQSHSHYGRNLGSGKHAVRCPWEDQHTEQRPAEDSDSVIWEAERGKWPTFYCSHDHCQGQTIRDVINLWQDADHFCAGPFPPVSIGDNHRLANFGKEHNTPDNSPPGWQPQLLLKPEELDLVSAQDTWPSRFVWYATKRTDAPVEFLEAAALAILSVAVGRKARLVLTTGPVIPTIWVMLVADSTRYRKSTVIALASDGVERAHLDVLAPDDFSPQRLINLMAERSGKPTLFRRDEFGGFYEGLNWLEHQAGGKQILIPFHDGRDYRKELVGQQQKDRKTGTMERKAEIIEVKEPFLSILAGTQRDLLLSQAQAGDIFSGFLPRFAFIMLESLPQRKDVLELDSSIEQERDVLVAELYRISDAPAQDMYLEPGVLQRWNHYTADLEQEMQVAPVPLVAGPVFDRMGHMALKIALLLAFCDGNKVMLVLD
jgi:hypothetical protein